MNIARGDGSYKDLMASYKKCQLLILDEWMHQPIGNGVIADAILDRIVYNSYEIMLNDDVNMRERMSLKQ